MELLDTENQDSGEGNSRDRERETVATMENWSLYVERYSTPPDQASPNHSQSLPERPEPPTNHPVSSDQAARGGRGRKRKNTNTTDIKQKVQDSHPFQLPSLQLRSFVLGIVILSVTTYLLTLVRLTLFRRLNSPESVNLINYKLSRWP